MKRLLSVFMAFTVIGSLLYCIPVNAESPADVGKTTSADKKWVYLTPDTAKKEIVVVGYKGTDTNVIIPEKIDGKTVVGVGDAYDRGSSAPSLFADSLKVTSVTLPKTVKEINDYVYEETGCDETGWEEGYWRIGDDPYIYGANIDTMPSLSKSTITEFKVVGENPYLTAVNGVLYNKDKTAIIRYPAGKSIQQFSLPESVTTVKMYTFANAQVKRVDLRNASKVLPFAFYKAKTEAVDNFNKVDVIREGVFLKSEIKEFPNVEKAKDIEAYAFAYCNNLTKIEIPLGVDYVSSHSFYSCKNLKKVDFGKIIYIGSAAFAQCTQLEEADLPETCRILGSYAFSNCRKLKMARLRNVEEIKGNAFYKCYSLVSFYEYDNYLWAAKKIGVSAFAKCTALESIRFYKPEAIEMAAFEGCTALKDISFSYYPEKIYATSFDNTAYVNNAKDGVVYIDKLALCYKAPKNPKTYIKIKAGTKVIADYCLYKLKGVKSIYLPKSVKYVYAVNLSSCKDLRRVYISNKDIELSQVSCQNKYTGNTTYYIQPNAYGAIKHFEEDKCNYKTNWNPDKTKSLKAVGKSKKTAKITWKKQGYVTGYKVYMKTSKNGKWEKVAELKGSNSTSYTKKNLKSGKTYYFRVRAYKTVEGKTYHGAYSSADAAKPKK